jgi:hypothetical protein
MKWQMSSQMQVAPLLTTPSVLGRRNTALCSFEFEPHYVTKLQKKRQDIYCHEMENPTKHS